jgi:hypothetical protein
MARAACPLRRPADVISPVERHERGPVLVSCFASSTWERSSAPVRSMGASESCSRPRGRCPSARDSLGRGSASSRSSTLDPTPARYGAVQSFAQDATAVVGARCWPSAERGTRAQYLTPNFVENDGVVVAHHNGHTASRRPQTCPQDHTCGSIWLAFLVSLGTELCDKLYPVLAHDHPSSLVPRATTTVPTLSREAPQLGYWNVTRRALAPGCSASSSTTGIGSEQAW